MIGCRHFMKEKERKKNKRLVDDGKIALPTGKPKLYFSNTSLFTE